MWGPILAIAALIAVLYYHSVVDDYYLDSALNIGKRLLKKNKGKEVPK